MHYSQIALAATPVFFTYVSAYGSAIIKNSCADDVYFWSCGDTPGEMTTVKGGSSHSEPYYSKAGGGGISLKIGVKYSSGPKAGQIPGIWDLPAPNMTQFEYTVGTPGPPANAVFYDISNINGYPFVAGGVKMTSPDGKVNVVCPKNVQYCQAAYNAPHDDHATGSAGDHVDLTMELCHDAPGITIGGTNAGSGGSDDGHHDGSDGGHHDGGSSGDSSPAPQSSAPATTPASSPPAQPSQTQQQPQHDEHHDDQHEQTQQKSQEQVAAPEKLAVNAPAPAQADVTVVRTITADPVVVTVNAQAGNHKRHEHVHQHVHNKINKKRHGN